MALAASALLTSPGGGSAAASAGSATPAQAPTAGSYYKDGPSGRYLLGGRWLYRPDDGVGLHNRFQASASASGWTPITVPNAWNAGQPTPAGYAPAVGWYRKDFLLPPGSPADKWIARFESVANQATIWLNGHQLATHTGAFLAFEVPLPRADLNVGSSNRLVLRVSDAHSQTDLPPSSRPRGAGVVGGWWNYGGLLREVYLRRVQSIDFSTVQVLPRIACATCAAEIRYSVVLHNYAPTRERVALRTSYGGTVASLGRATIAPGASASFSGRVRIANPQLWSPTSPHLYTVTLDVSAGVQRAAPLRTVAHYTLESGIRQVSVVGGQLLLNFRPLHVRGVGLVEDSAALGSALTPALQEQLIARAKALGATMIRSQYPLSQYEEQIADELGIMLWSEIPVYQVRDTKLRAATPAAVGTLRENILENGLHPSIVVWSIANELNPYVSAVQSAYIAAAVRAAHSLDPTRPVALAYQGYPGLGCQAGYAPVDVLGVNDYFGWYPGPSGQIADIGLLTDYLIKERACYPGKALLVSEFGAEANRDGPIDERGTYGFQSQFVASQLQAFGAQSWLSGAIYWALQDFLVRPGWSGGNPYPTPPIFHKGLYDINGNPKPAAAVVQQAYGATPQIG